MGLWRAEGGQLSRIVPTSIGLESQLEGYIESDPSVLGEPLLVIGRQVPTAHGGFVDLLALDETASLHVIELKRDRTPRDVALKPSITAPGQQPLAEAISTISSPPTVQALLLKKRLPIVSATLFLKRSTLHKNLQSLPPALTTLPSASCGSSMKTSMFPSTSSSSDIFRTTDLRTLPAAGWSIRANKPSRPFPRSRGRTRHVSLGTGLTGTSHLVKSQQAGNGSTV